MKENITTLERFKDLEKKYNFKLVGEYQGWKCKNNIQCSCGTYLEKVPYNITKVKNILTKNGNCFCTSIIRPNIHSSQSREERQQKIIELIENNGAKFLFWKENKKDHDIPAIECHSCKKPYWRNYKLFLNDKRKWCKACVNKLEVSPNRKTTFQVVDIREFINKNKLKNPVINGKELTYNCSKCNSKIEYSFAYINRQLGDITQCSGCRKSRGQSELTIFINSLGINIDVNNRTILLRDDKKTLELDIYLPDYKIGIEFNGDYWHSFARGVSNDYHLKKLELAEKNGARLIQVFEKEWNNKKEIVKSILKSAVGINDTTVFGRKTNVVQISKKEASDFLKINHIQGIANASVFVGLYLDKDLISVATFGKSRFNKNFDWECVRFANKLGYKVHGAFSKLLKYFEYTYSPKSLISYSDRRFFTGGVYEKSGFKFLNNSKPAYWYFKGNSEFFSRQKFQKHKLHRLLEEFDPALSEWENMKKNKWNKIYDAGNKVWVKIY